MSAAMRRRILDGIDAAVRAGHDGMPRRLAVSLAAILSPMMRMCSAVGPMKVIAVVLEDLGETGVLGQEAVARVDGVGAGDLAGRQRRGMFR
jgi:hypothetical protein